MGLFSSIAGPLIGAAGSLIGGAFSSSSSSKAQRRAIEAAEVLNRNRVQWTVEDAKKAGIHPLAALGASSLGGFALPQYLSSSAMGDAVGTALGTLGQGVSDYFQQDADREAEERARADRERELDQTRMENVAQRAFGRRFDRLNEELIRAQIEEMRSRTLLAQARAAAVGASMGGNSNTVIDEFGNVVSPHSGQGILAGGRRLVVEPGRASAQQFADEYGDVLSEFYGLGRFMRDWWNSE